MYSQNTRFNQYPAQTQQQYTPEQIQYQFNSMIQPLTQQMQMIGNQIEEIKYRFQSAYPQYFQQPQQQQMQPQQPQQMQTDIVGIAPVTSMDEVKAQTPSPVGKKLFTNFKQGEVSFVYFDNDGNKAIDVYVKSNGSEPENVPQAEFATINDINYVLDYIKMLEEQIKIGGTSHESRTNNENNSEQSTNDANVSATTK